MTTRIPRCHPISGTLAVIAALLLNACGRPTVVNPAAPTPEPSPAAAPAGEPEASASVPATASPQGREGEPLISDAAVRDWLRRANEAYVPVPPDPAGRQLVVGGSSDSADGLSFDTIQKALDAARPGDRIFVRAGHYSETVRFPRSGAEGKPIILEGERGTNGEWLSVIDPGVPLTGWTPAPEIGEGVFKRP